MGFGRLSGCEVFCFFVCFRFGFLCLVGYGCLGFGGVVLVFGGDPRLFGLGGVAGDGSQEVL